MGPVHHTRRPLPDPHLIPAGIWRVSSFQLCCSSPLFLSLNALSLLRQTVWQLLVSPSETGVCVEGRVERFARTVGHSRHRVIVCSDVPVFFCCSGHRMIVCSEVPLCPYVVCRVGTRRCFKPYGSFFFSLGDTGATTNDVWTSLCRFVRRLRVR